MHKKNVPKGRYATEELVKTGEELDNYEERVDILVETLSHETTETEKDKLVEEIWELQRKST